MPSSWHKSLTLVSGCPIAAMVSRSLAAVILNGRPPFLPRARAEAKPAIVRFSDQLKVDVESWDKYGQREQTRREHLVKLGRIKRTLFILW